MTFWVVLILVALGAMVFLLLRRSGSGLETREIAKFTPIAENDKVVIVRGWSEEELRKIIDDFIESYKKDSYPPYTIELHEEGDGICRLTFSKDIHPLLFTFLINYLAYPFDFDLTNRSVLVAGSTTLSSAFEGVDTSLLGQKATLYIPENDRDHDVVYMKTQSGINLANSFDVLTWRRASDSRLSNEVRKLIEGI